MVKKTKSFAERAAAERKKPDSVHVKYVQSVLSEKTGHWRFNEQMIALKDGEQLDTALKRMDEAANLIDIDLSDFESKEPADPLEKHDEETGDTEADAGTTDTSDEDVSEAPEALEEIDNTPYNINLYDGYQPIPLSDLEKVNKLYL